jgi:hypothetical protein
MALANKPIHSITEADLEELITNQTAEGKNVEYKVSLSLSSDEEKKEFLADISSFANTAGGYVVYGMKEDKGLPIDLPGIPIPDMDAEKLRLENIIRDGITPRIQGVGIEIIGLKNGNKALVVYMPQSWSSPHMVSYKKSSRFYARNSAGKYQLDVQELRQAFLFSETASEKIRDFRLERVAKIGADETPIQLTDHVKIVIHVIPLSSFSTYQTINLVDVAQNFIQYFRNATSRKYNIDGFISFLEIQDNIAQFYYQVFRAGQVEFVTSRLARQKHDDTPVIASLNAEDEIIEACLNSLNMQKACSIEPPIFVLISLTGVKGVILASKNTFDFPQHTFDRDTILTSEILLENYPQDKDHLSTLLKPALDAMWNAAGFPGSPNFNKEGLWRPRQ